MFWLPAMTFDDDRKKPVGETEHNLDGGSNPEHQHQDRQDGDLGKSVCHQDDGKKGTVGRPVEADQHAQHQAGDQGHGERHRKLPRHVPNGDRDLYVLKDVKQRQEGLRCRREEIGIVIGARANLPGEHHQDDDAQAQGDRCREPGLIRDCRRRGRGGGGAFRRTNHSISPEQRHQ